MTTCRTILLCCEMNYLKLCYYLLQQLVMVQLVLWGHPAGIEHNHLPAIVIITCRDAERQR